MWFRHGIKLCWYAIVLIAPKLQVKTRMFHENERKWIKGRKRISSMPEVSIVIDSRFSHLLFSSQLLFLLLGSSLDYCAFNDWVQRLKTRLFSFVKIKYLMIHVNGLREIRSVSSNYKILKYWEKRKEIVFCVF